MEDRRGLRILIGTLTTLVVGGAMFFMLLRRGDGLAQDFVVPDLQGNAVRLSALRGQVVFLNLWATWCPPCREEMPSMQRLYEKFKDRGLAMLAVSNDEDRAALDGFVKEHPVTFRVLHDPGRQVGDAYGVWGYPETFLIDRSGRVVEHVIGPRAWDSPEQIAAIERLLAAAPAGLP